MAMSLAGAGHSEIIIKKSRFIGMVCPVDGRAHAQQIVAQLREHHPQAVHICWALMAGGESAAVDDGEPSGTAGRPMLEVLRHHDLEGVLATVVRYFGGIKLGAGGLVRAYTDTTAQALINTKKIARIQWVKLQCQLPYAFEGTVRRALSEFDAKILEAHHGAEVTIIIQLPLPHKDAFVQRIDSLCQGCAYWQ